MTRRFLTVCACVLLGPGCASSSPEKAPEPAPAPDPPEQLAPEAATALVNCRNSIDAIEDRPRDERVEFAVESCSSIWLEEPCAAAFDESLDMESFERAGLIFRTCRDAYCPELPADTALCQAPLEGPVSLVKPLADPAKTDPLEAWAQFNSMIFVRDYGADPEDQFVTGFPSMLLQLVVVAPPRSER